MSDADVQTRREQTATEDTSSPSPAASSQPSRRSALRGMSLASQQALLSPGGGMEVQLRALSPSQAQGPAPQGVAPGVQRKEVAGDAVVQMQSDGTPLFEDSMLDIQTESDGIGGDAGLSGSVTTSAPGASNDEQKVQALSDDLAAWEEERIKRESALAVTQGRLDNAERAAALSEYDEAAQAEVEALRAETERLKASAEEATRIEELRRGQVAAVASGDVAVGDLTRDPGDPGVGVVGTAISSTTVEGSVNIDGASASISDTQDGATTKTSGSVNFGDELSVGGSQSTTRGTDSNTTAVKAQATEDGVVLTGSNEVRQGDETRSAEVTATVETDHLALGVKAGEGRDTTDSDGNGYKVSYNVAPGIGARVEVKPDAAGTAYVLTGEVYFSIGAGVDGSAQGTASAGGEHSTQVQGTASASASASYKGSLSFARPLTAEEAASYSGDLSATSDGDSLPEFPWLAAWAAAVGEIASGNVSASAMSSPESAAGMRVGEHYQIASETDWKVCVKGGIGVVSGGAKAGGKGSREMKVGRSAAGVDLSLTFGTEATRGADGSVTFEGVTVGIGTSTKETYGASGTFTLDPAAADFATKFAEIETQLSATDSVEGLATAYAAFGDHLTAFSESVGTEGTNTMSVGAGGVELEMGRGTERGDVRTQDGVVSTGGNSITADVKVADTGLLHAGIDEQGEFTADADGLGAELTRTTESTGLGLEGSEWTPSALWSSLAGGGVKGALAERITVARSRIQRISVTPENMRVLLTERVHDVPNWNRVYVTVRNHEEWGALGGRLRSPAPQSADVAQYGEDLATLIDHCDALADFMTASNAYETLEWALNRWGEDNGGFTGNSGQRSSDTRDLGTYVDWPSSLSHEDPKYKKALEDAEGARATLSALTDETAVGEKTRDLITELVRIKMVIEDNASRWEDSRARLEMCAALDDGVLQVRSAKDEVLAALGMGEDPTMVSVDVDTTAVDSRRIAMLEGLLREYKSSEQDHFTRIQESLGAYQREQHSDIPLVGGLLAAGSQLMAEDWRTVTHDYERMVEQWVREVKDLRTLYIEGGDQCGDIKVSLSPTMERDPNHEPDMVKYREILEAHSDQETFWDLANDSAKRDWIRRNSTY